MLRLRPTGAADMAELAAMEADPDTGRWLGETGLRWHERALADPDQEHLAAWAGSELAGFVVLAGLRRADRSIELRRMVIAPRFRGAGRGRALLAAALGRAREQHRARLVWLDVKAGNLRARSLYAAAGFTLARTQPGTGQPGPEDLLIMEHPGPPGL
jgi:diamine N-acetyltransferase